MSRAIENPSLVCDLLEWVSARPRSYQEVMSAWRTSCPRLPVWEDSVDAGLVRLGRDGMRPGCTVVGVTDEGLRYLEAHGRPRPAPAAGRGDRERSVRGG